MPTPHSSEQFGDLLDPLFQKVHADRLKQLPDMLPMLYHFEPTNGRETMKWSELGTVPDYEPFTGSVAYGAQTQGFDMTVTPQEFTRGIQVRRKLFADDQYNEMNSRPKGMATAWVRTRQKHGARIFIFAFGIDTFGFYNHTENVALCSDSHLTNAAGVSTANGFDNLGTAPLTAVGVAAARIQMKGFRGDLAERIDVAPDELWVPIDLEERAWEITNAIGKLDVATNNPNFFKGMYKIMPWNYMPDTTDWFMVDSMMREEHLHWTDREPLEFAMVEDFDTLIAKWRGYGRYGMGYTNWRWLMGHQVT